MHSHQGPLHLVLALTLVLCSASAVCMAPVWCDELPSQEGLPRELVIPESPPLTDQLKTLRALAVSGAEYAPKPGFLDGIKKMFSGGENAKYVTIEALAEHASEIRGKLVRVEGIYDLEGDHGVLRSEGHKVIVALAGGIAPLGFEGAADSLDGLPVAAQGIVETQDSTALVRATLLVPSLTLTQLRIGRILELQQDYKGAMDAYLKVANNRALSQGPFAAFARVRGAQIAFDELRDVKTARKQYSAAWQPYSVTDAEGKPLYYTWVPRKQGGWEKISVKDAIHDRLDALNRGGTAYQIVQFFVSLGGGNAAFGILIMAVVVRLGIYPLTRKQLESARRMQEIQPQMKALQKKHADDKQKFQEEFWKLCKENDCNPLGGCLPMLVQMPILIFLYRGIRDYVVQFDGASFLWVSNLAQPDLPLLIAYTISMIGFQKMVAQTQPATDPQQEQQQKMMQYLMPVMFFFFFQGFPAAFILYWLATNLIYFGEQWVYHRRASAEKTGEGNKPKREAKGGFVATMAKALGGRDGNSDDRKPAVSYEEKLKQGKTKKRAKHR